MAPQDLAQTDKDFAAKMATIKPGQVYPELIVTPLGFHVMKLIERQPPGPAPLAEVKEGLTQLVTQNQQRMALLKWLQKERSKAKIQVAPEFKDYIAGKNKPKSTTTASKPAD
jgi:parvulin-like peptidyl-prolyl isomerase